MCGDQDKRLLEVLKLLLYFLVLKLHSSFHSFSFY